jgi:hypothetical protein
MVVVVLFNSGGYDLFFQYLMYRSDSGNIKKINHNNYRTADLVEVKVPVVLPAQALQEYSGEYTSIAGQIQINNNKFDYAEIKITHDTLYLRVLPNAELVKLCKANVLYGKLVNDLPTSNTKRSGNTFAKKSISESEFTTFNYRTSVVTGVENANCSFALTRTVERSLEVSAQPPEA